MANVSITMGEGHPRDGMDQQLRGEVGQSSQTIGRKISGATHPVLRQYCIETQSEKRKRRMNASTPKDRLPAGVNTQTVGTPTVGKGFQWKEIPYFAKPDLSGAR
jgi:hypothetical protein